MPLSRCDAAKRSLVGLLKALGRKYNVELAFGNVVTLTDAEVEKGLRNSCCDCARSLCVRRLLTCSGVYHLYLHDCRRLELMPMRKQLLRLHRPLCFALDGGGARR